MTAPVIARAIIRIHASLFRKNDDEPPASDPNPGGPASAPVDNLAVVEAMHRVAVHDTPATRSVLFKQLLDTRLLALTPAAPKVTGTRTTQAGESLTLVTVADADGSVLPLFTGPDAIARWRPQGAGYVALPSRALFERFGVGGPSQTLSRVRSQPRYRNDVIGND